MRLLIGSTSPIMSSCNSNVTLWSTLSPLQQGELPPHARLLGDSPSLRAAPTEQDPFSTYLGQEVSSVSEILNEGGFHLACHGCPVCTHGNPPSHQVDPADTERSATGSSSSLQATGRI